MTNQSSFIVVTGSNGQLGMELREIEGNYPLFKFVFLDKENGPVNDLQLFEKLFKKYKPSYFINCAAYTAVDKAEVEKDAAFEINGKSAGNLALLCSNYKTRFIHISTDYVFDGKRRTPLNENDMVSPINIYGESKLLGEILTQKNNSESIIIRTSWLYSSYGKNFVKTMISLMGERRELKIINDQVGSPTYASDLAEMIMHIINSEKWYPGIYHFSNNGIISWFDFAEEIKSYNGLNCTLIPIKTEQFPTAATRPAYSVMNKNKITQTFNIELSDWRSSLHKCLDKINLGKKLT